MITATLLTKEETYTGDYSNVVLFRLFDANRSFEENKNALQDFEEYWSKIWGSGDGFRDAMFSEGSHPNADFGEKAVLRPPKLE